MDSLTISPVLNQTIEIIVSAKDMREAIEALQKCGIPPDSNTVKAMLEVQEW